MQITRKEEEFNSFHLGELENNFMSNHLFALFMVCGNYLAFTNGEVILNFKIWGYVMWPVYVVLGKDLGCFSYGKTVTYNPNLQPAFYTLQLLFYSNNNFIFNHNILYLAWPILIQFV